MDIQEFLDWRGIREACKKCSGTGYVIYGSTAIWRGGIGGAAMTPGVCDKCWGSGDETRKWVDLRAMERRKECREDILSALRFLVGVIQENSDWDDGCLYYNKKSASELQRPLQYAEKILKRVDNE